MTFLRPFSASRCSHVAWEAKGLYSTHLLTARATALIEATPKAQKLFLYLPYQSVYTGFDIILDRISRLSQPRTTPHAPWAMHALLGGHAD